jgi:hypothetical protein
MVGSRTVWSERVLAAAIAGAFAVAGVFGLGRMASSSQRNPGEPVEKSEAPAAPIPAPVGTMPATVVTASRHVASVYECNEGGEPVVSGRPCSRGTPRSGASGDR